MSRENVMLVRQGLADAEYVGREEVIRACRQYWGTFVDYQFDAEELIDAGSSVVVVAFERGRGKGSGVPVERRYAQVWTFRRGRIIRWEMFPDRTAALEAVGLREQPGHP